MARGPQGTLKALTAQSHAPIVPILLVQYSSPV